VASEEKPEVAQSLENTEFTETEVEGRRISAGPGSPARPRSVPDWELLVHSLAVFVRVANTGLTGYGK
jgi:hypothetical protein